MEHSHANQHMKVSDGRIVFVNRILFENAEIRSTYWHLDYNAIKTTTIPNEYIENELRSANGKLLIISL